MTVIYDDDGNPIDLHVVAWFAPRVEETEDGTSFTIVHFCQVCKMEVTRRVFEKLPDDMKMSERAKYEQLRHEQARIDGRAFLVHLEKMHPEKYVDGGTAG